MGCCFSKQENLSIIEMNKINPEMVSYFSFKGKVLMAKPCHIYDGDTFSICFSHNNEIMKWRCRCLGYDSPEMKPLLKNLNRDKEKELAKLAKARLEELLTANASNGLVKVICGDFDKYGRILVTVCCYNSAESINDIMIKEGHGKIYDGGKKDNNWV